MTLIVRKMPGKWPALGVAAHYLCRREPFSRFPAGELIGTLNGQLQRGHYLFVLDDATRPAKVVGYAGWALYDHAAAERYAATGAPPAEELAEGGDVAWILTAAADSRPAFFALLREMRRLYPQHRAMAVRHKGGRRVLFDRWPPGHRDNRP
jgi:hemolysin-activating ACP:hemolysin acyltransferase